MRHVSKQFGVVVSIAFACVVLPHALSAGQGGKSALVPPQSHAFGKSFTEWNVLWTQRSVEEALAGGSEIGETVKSVLLLPTVIFPGSYEFDVTLRPGTPFVDSPFFVYGESYDDPTAPDDTPQLVADLGIFEDAQIRVVLDGKVLLEGSGADLGSFMFGPTYFDDPIVYEVPQPRGPGLNATSALFVQGIGMVFHPLPVGKHTLVNTVHSSFFGDFEFTYHIGVTQK